MLFGTILGFPGSYLHLQLAGDFLTEDHIGLRYAITVSAAVLFQYMMQNVIRDHAFIAYTLLITCFLLALFSFVGAKEDSREDVISDKETDPLKGNMLLKAVVSGICILILLELIGNFMTTSLLEQVASDNPITYDFPRLFIIFAYMAAGICTDFKKGRYLPVFTLCIIFISILNPILVHNGRDYVINTCLYYIMAGSVNSYLTLSFVKLAAGTRQAPVISSLGRVVDSVFTCLFATPLLYRLSLEGVIFIELIAIILIMLLLAFSGQLSFSETEQEKALVHIRPEAFAEEFGFTQKEKEIFLTAVTHSGTTSELARSLFMSRSVLYRHFTRICEKTGCVSFKDVLTLFYKMPAKTSSAMEPASFHPADATDKTFKAGEWVKSASDDQALPVLADVRDENINKQKDAQNKTADTKTKLQRFADRFQLNDNEAGALELFLSHPEMTQQQLAEQRGVTLRTMQRHLASLRKKTGCASLVELTAKYERDA